MVKLFIGMMLLGSMSSMSSVASDRSLDITCLTGEGQQFSAQIYEYSDGSVDYSDDNSGDLYMTGGDLDMPGSIDTIERSLTNNIDELIVFYDVEQILFLPIFGLKIGTYHQKLNLSIDKNSGTGQYFYKQSEPDEKTIKIKYDLVECSLEQN